MEYLIIVGILLMVVAPVIAVLPNPSQRKKMALRKAAMSLGINVEITSIDDPDPLQAKYLSSSGKRLPSNLKVVAYRVHCVRPTEWDDPRRRNWVIERRLDNEEGELPGAWCWKGEPPPELSEKLLSFIKAGLATAMLKRKTYLSIL